MTLTAPRNSETNAILGEIGCAHLEERNVTGYAVKEQRRQGFIGCGAEGVYYGLSDSHGMLIASGIKADEIAKECKIHGIRPKCTRADFHVTLKMARERKLAPLEVGRRASRFAQSSPHQLPKKFSFVEDTTGGCSATIGSRSASRYHRCYDKTAEQRGQVEPNLLRFETEFKKHLAQFLFGQALTQDDLVRLAQNIIGQEWERLGVPLAMLTERRALELPSSYTPTDLERTLAWFSGPVNSAFAKLARQGRDADGIRAIVCHDAKESRRRTRDKRLERERALSALRS